jgi:hypothetical protein
VLAALSPHRGPGVYRRSELLLFQIGDKAETYGTNNLIQSDSCFLGCDRLLCGCMAGWSSEIGDRKKNHGDWGLGLASIYPRLLLGLQLGFIQYLSGQGGRLYRRIHLQVLSIPVTHHDGRSSFQFLGSSTSDSSSCISLYSIFPPLCLFPLSAFSFSTVHPRVSFLPRSGPYFPSHLPSSAIDEFFIPLARRWSRIKEWEGIEPGFPFPFAFSIISIQKL